MAFLRENFMHKLRNDRLLKAIKHEKVDALPIWIMRQAGRYLPEYRALRKKAGSFLKLCKTPELACEVTLQPLARFPLDAAILFSDILTIPDAMGLGLHFIEGEGPCFEKTIRTQRDVDNLPIPIPEESLHYVLEAIGLIQHELAGNVPLIGFCGSPWTVATYMVEGRANKTFPAIRLMLKDQPLLLHQLLAKLADAIQKHLQAQIDAGVQVVMLFDTWGGMLDTPQYQAFSLYYLQQILTGLIQKNPKQSIPTILFTKSGGQWLNLLAETGCDVIGVDWEVNLREARANIGGKALQGNMNPNFLYESPDKIRIEVARIIHEYGTYTGHIFNLGHGIPQDVSPENVAVLVDAVHSVSRDFYAKHHA